MSVALLRQTTEEAGEGAIEQVVLDDVQLEERSNAVLLRLTTTLGLLQQRNEEVEAVSTEETDKRKAGKKDTLEIVHGG